MTLESAISGQSFQIQSMETSSVEEMWLDLHSAFFPNTPVASVPNEMLQKLVLFFSCDLWTHKKPYTFKFYIVLISK